ncbi:hypothetical protein ACSQ67_024025 [Phaseolus vulgaris]
MLPKTRSIWSLELEELVGCEQRQGDEIGKTKVELPRLKVLIFMHLSNFSQEIELPNLKNSVVYECPKLSLTPTTTFEKLKEIFPYKDFKNTGLFEWDIMDLMEDLDEDSSISSSDFTSSQDIGNIGNKSIEEGASVEGVKTKHLSTSVEDISIGSGVATHIESGGVDILAQHSKVVEQDDKMNEGKARIMPSQEIQVEEGLNLLDKQEDIRTRLEAYRHFVDMDDAQIALLVEAITTYPHLWNACEKFSERFQAWRLKILADMLLFLRRKMSILLFLKEKKSSINYAMKSVEIGFEISWVDEMRQHVLTRDPKSREDIAKRQMDENPKRYDHLTLDYALKDKQRISEPCLMNQQKPLGEISIEQVVVEETIAKNTMAASSIPSNPQAHSLDQIFTFQSKSNPHSEIRNSQTKTRTAKTSEGHRKINQDFGTNDILSLFAPVDVGKEGEDNIVGKTLVELEKYLKMSLKDIVTSETNDLRLLSALNFLFNLPFEDVTLSNGLKDIIGTMQQEFLSIVYSFKQGFATTEKLANLKLVGMICPLLLFPKFLRQRIYTMKLNSKKVVLKEQINRLKEEIKLCEAALSSLEEEKINALREL